MNSDNQQTCRTCSNGKSCMNWILCNLDGGLHVSCEPICMLRKKQLRRIEYRTAELSDMREQLVELAAQPSQSKGAKKSYHDLIDALDRMLNGMEDIFSDVARYRAFRLLVPFKKRPGYKQFER